MKLGKPFVCLLLTFVAMSLSCGGWAWITWPARTARHFIALVTDGRYGEANQLLCRPSSFERLADGNVVLHLKDKSLRLRPEAVQIRFSAPVLRFVEPDLASVALGERCFQTGALLFSVRRGRVECVQTFNVQWSDAEDTTPVRNIQRDALLLDN